MPLPGPIDSVAGLLTSIDIRYDVSLVGRGVCLIAGCLTRFIVRDNFQSVIAAAVVAATRHF